MEDNKEEIKWILEDVIEQLKIANKFDNNSVAARFQTGVQVRRLESLIKHL